MQTATAPFEDYQTVSTFQPQYAPRIYSLPNLIYGLQADLEFKFEV